MFDEENKLETVTLNPVKKHDCATIRSRLRNRYGQPSEASDLIHADIARWDDYENSNMVVFLALDKDGCTIQYSKLPPTHSDGNNL